MHVHFLRDHHKRAKKIFTRLMILLGISLTIFSGVSYLYKQRQIERDLASIDPLGEQEARCSIDQEPAGPWPAVTHKRYEVHQGETLAQVLYNAGVSNEQAQDVIKSLKDHFSPSSLQVGCSVYIRCSVEEEEGACDLQRLSFLKDNFTRVVAERDENSESAQFSSYIQDRELSKKKVFVKGVVTSGLYADATRLGVPSATLTEIMKAFSYDVDFQRDFKKGDKFEFVYVTLNDKNGKFVAASSMIYGKLVLSDGPVQIYRYKLPTGEYSYFNERGDSVIKGLLRTPVDGSRITSGFSLHRRHPILGYTRMHKGVDFGVRIGTPIMAAGDGVILKAGFSYSYGNHVKIKHKSGYETLYAHMSKIHRSSHPGKHVGQGQVIGYVGCTGLCSGPHLHYEVIVAGVHINPQKVRQLPGVSLKGRDLNQFLAFKDGVEQVLGETPSEQLADRLNTLEILNVF